MVNSQMGAMERSNEVEKRYELQVHNAYTNGDYEQAARLLEEALEQVPNGIGLRLLKLQVLSAMGQISQAQGEGERLLQEELTPEQERQTVLLLVELLGKQGQRTKARAFLEAWAQSHQDGEVLWLLVKTAFVQEDYETVQRLTEDLKKMDVKLSLLVAGAFYHAEAVRHCAGREAAREEYETLAPMLRRWVMEEPDNREAALCLLMTWTVLGQWKDALTLAKQLEEETEAHPLQDWVTSQQEAEQ